MKPHIVEVLETPDLHPVDETVANVPYLQLQGPCGERKLIDVQPLAGPVVGAVAVHDGQLTGHGHNRDPMSHREIEHHLTPPCICSTPLLIPWRNILTH